MIESYSSLVHRHELSPQVRSKTSCECSVSQHRVSPLQHRVDSSNVRANSVDSFTQWTALDGGRECGENGSRPSQKIVVIRDFEQKIAYWRSLDTETVFAVAE